MRRRQLSAAVNWRQAARVRASRRGVQIEQREKYAMWYKTYELVGESSLLGAFTKLREATISFAMSVRPFVYPYGTRLHLTDFHEN